MSRRPVTAWATLLAACVGLAALVASACGSGRANDAPPAPKPAEQVCGPDVNARIEAADLSPNFEEISFYHDIPGLLLDSSDPLLSELGSLAREPGRSDGQGFANPETGELLFVITLVLNSPAAAQEALDYVVVQPIGTIFEFISPDEQLFESAELSPPRLGTRAARYTLRYGVEEAERRIRDVATDLVMFTDGCSLLFLVQSVNIADKPAVGESAVITTVGRAISEALADVRTAQAEQPREAKEPLSP